MCYKIEPIILSSDNSCYTYKGVTIRKGSDNTIRIRVDEAQLISFIDEAERTGMSIAELVRVSSKPCSYCKDIQVVAQNPKGEFVQVKRGLICANYRKQTSGATIINQKKPNNEPPK